MSDIAIVWDPANSRGDWAYKPFSIAGTQVNVSPPTVFGTGDGVTPAFTLTPTAGAIAAIISAQLYRNDWQGNQLLYATPRTNIIRQSSNMNLSPWLTATGTSFLGTVTQSTDILAPDGTSTPVNKIVTVNGSNLVARNTHNVPIGQRTGSIWVYLPSGQSVTGLTFNNDWGDLDTGSSTTLTDLDKWVKLTSAVTITTPRTWQDFNIIKSTGGVLPSGITFYMEFCQDENGTGGSYIPTTTADVTVTDYTLTPTGGVALAVPPAPSAVLSWTGSYISNVTTPGGLQTGNDLETATLISLFTDRIADAGDAIKDGTGDPRGWWGDLGEDVPIGSRLWLLDRSKQTQEVLNNARDYALEALQWMLDDQVVASIDVQTEWVRSTFLGMQITLYQPFGPQISLAYAWAWNQLS